MLSHNFIKQSIECLFYQRICSLANKHIMRSTNHLVRIGIAHKYGHDSSKFLTFWRIIWKPLTNLFHFLTNHLFDIVVSDTSTIMSKFFHNHCFYCIHIL